MRGKELVAVGAVFLGALAFAAAQDNAVSYAKDIEPVFVGACGDCHGGDNPKKGLDLSFGRGLASLTGHQSTEVKEMALVTPGNPDASYLWKKLTRTATEGRGMPRTLFGSKTLPQAQLDLVERWIKDGAKP